MFNRRAGKQTFEGARVLILTGEFEGEEGICLGESSKGRWAISPERSDKIVLLAFETEFALLLDLSVDPQRN